MASHNGQSLGCGEAAVLAVPPPSLPPFAFNAVVGCRSDRWRGTYERAKASAKATDKNKSCAGENVSLAIGLEIGAPVWMVVERRVIPFMVNVCDDA